MQFFTLAAEGQIISSEKDKKKCKNKRKPLSERPAALQASTDVVGLNSSAGWLLLLFPVFSLQEIYGLMKDGIFLTFQLHKLVRAVYLVVENDWSTVE